MLRHDKRSKIFCQMLNAELCRFLAVFSQIWFVHFFPIHKKLVVLHRNFIPWQTDHPFYIIILGIRRMKYNDIQTLNLAELGHDHFILILEGRHHGIALDSHRRKYKLAANKRNDEREGNRFGP
ncbi:Uncharacterised protein [Mycobacteroides abscessus subsp. abscessus]|nr:Uncharacterised protein [Mycobacteroides abscessus subsp. abscessus]